MLINSHEVKFKRPTLRIERDARVLVMEFVSAGEKEAQDATEANFSTLSDIWKRLVATIVENPEGLEYENLTRGEVEAISSGFFSYAQERPNFEGGQKT